MADKGPSEAEANAVAAAALSMATTELEYRVNLLNRCAIVVYIANRPPATPDIQSCIISLSLNQQDGGDMPRALRSTAVSGKVLVCHVGADGAYTQGSYGRMPPDCLQIQGGHSQRRREQLHRPVLRQILAGARGWGGGRGRTAMGYPCAFHPRAASKLKSPLLKPRCTVLHLIYLAQRLTFAFQCYSQVVAIVGQLLGAQNK